jgi:hypothetical protein
MTVLFALILLATVASAETRIVCNEHETECQPPVGCVVLEEWGIAYGSHGTKCPAWEGKTECIAQFKDVLTDKMKYVDQRNCVCADEPLYDLDPWAGRRRP